MELLAISSKTWINLGVVAAIFAGTAIIIGLFNSVWWAKFLKLT